jgi:hypothetical protein
MVAETVVDRIPYCETRREEYTVNQRVCHRVAKQVPYTVTRCVPRCVERQETYEQCFYVPETVCTNGCGTAGGCTAAPDAGNPQPEAAPATEEKPAPRA